ncbi:MAG: hypothetical protein ACKO1U_06175 [Bacteroidota bacterium]
MNKVVWIAAIALGLFFVTTKHLDNCYDKVIMAEGHGYYAYLLSDHIYHDPTFEFFNQLYPRYYCESFDPPTRNFINEFEGIRVNKYYPGVSLLWLPFFLIAHLLAIVLGFSADGYSDIYQYAIGIAGIFYTVLGIHFSRRCLERFGISPPVQAAVLLTLLFGTNLLIYSGAWSSQTHAYSFFLISALSYQLFNLFDAATPDRSLRLCYVFILGALSVTVRPQSSALFFLLPFFGATREKAAQIFKKEFFTKKAIVGLVVAVGILMRVSFLWHEQTGRWLLNPYHGESYHLFEPHVLDILFSFRKGWLLYSPFVAFGLIGLLFSPSPKERINLILFWSLLVYVSSCWWCWTYSQTSFGQRTFVDFYVLIGLQAGLMVEKLWSRFRYLILMLFVAFISLNLLQTHQYRIGVLDGDRCDRESYFKNFFSIRPIAAYPIPAATIVQQERIVEEFDEKISDRRIVPSVGGKGMSTILSDSVIYSDGVSSELPLFLDGSERSHIRIRADITAPYGIGDAAYLVVDLQRNGNSFGYSSFPLRPYIHDRHTTGLEFGMEMPESVTPGDRIKVYAWKKDSNELDTVFIDRIQVEFIRTDSSLVLLKR